MFRLTVLYQDGERYYDTATFNTKKALESAIQSYEEENEGYTYRIEQAQWIELTYEISPPKKAEIYIAYYTEEDD